MLAAFACSIAAVLGGAPAASAVQTDIYDPFIDTPATCPVDSPAFNNPAFPEVTCFASTMATTSLTMGKVKVDSSSPTSLGFAINVSQGEAAGCFSGVRCFDALPGSTVLDAEPFIISPLQPKQGKAKFPWWENFGWPSKLFQVKATLELAGDVRGFAVSTDPSKPAPLMTLPVKVHLQNPLLGKNCYIGSNQSPIAITYWGLSLPTTKFVLDPNKLGPFTIALQNLDIGDNAFSVPEAQGCGPQLGFGKYKIHLFDKAVNAAVGLPSPAGKNLVVHTGGTALMTIGTGPSLKAAFAAAQIP